MIAVALLAALMVTPPAAARGSAKPVFRGVITFVKNYDHPDRSRLTWVLKKRVRKAGKKHWVRVEKASWRAGSGMGGRRGTNSCIHNVGWLPDGRYHVRLYANYPGRLIRGRALRLDDKRCPDGTKRRALFIHTEQDSWNRQCRDRRGDQPCRWEYPKYDDYHSAGCIKLSPHALRSLVEHYRRHFRTGVRYGIWTVSLRVVSPPFSVARGIAAHR